MTYKYFSIQLIVRIIFILLNMICISAFIIHAERMFTTITLLLILVIQIGELYRFLMKTNAEIEQFVQSLKHEESGTRFISTSKSNKLYDHFNEILEYIEKIRIEREAQFHFLNVILKNADVGIIALAENNTIEILNNTAKRILHCQKIKNWNEFKKLYPDFAEKVNKVKPDHHDLIEFNIKEEKVKLSVSVSQIKILEKAFSIIVFQNIRSEIEQSELDSWNKLIRTMAHEIMNSITPISSLTETGIRILEDENGNVRTKDEITTSKLEKLTLALKTIEKRSNSLMHFVEDFRALARIPEPKPGEIDMCTFIQELEKLFASVFNHEQIAFKTAFESDNMYVYADQKLLEQLFVNLLKNSIEALQGISSPEIRVKCYYDDKYKIVEIIDNGIGISAEEKEKLFVPFYSTKENGSGIGLSLSRQIMQLHKGKIDIISKENEGTTVRLTFL